MKQRAKRSQRKLVRRRNAHMRVRNRISGTAERPRLAVFKSLKYIYAQVIDDRAGVTLASASSVEQALRADSGGSGSNKEAAKLVGEAIGKRAKEKGVDKVVFDRGGYIFHGNVKALAEAARGQGLDF